MTGKLAISKSGHDKDHLYVIVKEDADFVYLADGVLKLVDNPKKKNKKHIQIIKKSKVYFNPAPMIFHSANWYLTYLGSLSVIT